MVSEREVRARANSRVLEALVDSNRRLCICSRKLNAGYNSGTGAGRVLRSDVNGPRRERSGVDGIMSCSLAGSSAVLRRRRKGNGRHCVRRRREVYEEARGEEVKVRGLLEDEVSELS